mmetsp:Transcript_6918/g.16433  ORF Transcript_6918/g.16433 Transcript_6918/m.16433 type:complete len:311 (-) Transcript_6918:270-1202(-)
MAHRVSHLLTACGRHRAIRTCPCQQPLVVKHVASAGPIGIPLAEEDLQRRSCDNFSRGPEVCRVGQLGTILSLGFLGECSGREAQAHSQLYQRLSLDTHALQKVLAARRTEFSWCWTDLRHGLLRRDHAARQDIWREDPFLLGQRRSVALWRLQSLHGLCRRLRNLFRIVVESHEPLDHAADLFVFVDPLHVMPSQHGAQCTHGWLRSYLGGLGRFPAEAGSATTPAAAVAAIASSRKYPPQPLRVKQAPLCEAAEMAGAGRENPKRDPKQLGTGSKGRPPGAVVLLVGPPALGIQRERSNAIPHTLPIR